MTDPVSYNPYAYSVAANYYNTASPMQNTLGTGLQQSEMYYHSNAMNAALQSPWHQTTFNNTPLGQSTAQAALQPALATDQFKRQQHAASTPLPRQSHHQSQQQMTTPSVRPLIAHILPDTSVASTTSSPSRAGHDSEANKPNILMRNPARQMGFLNEYAEIFKSIVPRSIYNSLWGVEMAYVGAESILSSLINARRDAKAQHLTPREELKSDGIHLGSRAIFHSIATVGVPTVIISGISPLMGKEMHGFAGGLKGVSEMALKAAGAAPPIVKYGTVALTFLTLPFMSKFLDPVVEGALHKILPKS